MWAGGESGRRPAPIAQPELRHHLAAQVQRRTPLPGFGCFRPLAGTCADLAAFSDSVSLETSLVNIRSARARAHPVDEIWAEPGGDTSSLGDAHRDASIHGSNRPSSINSKSIWTCGMPVSSRTA